MFNQHNGKQLGNDKDKAFLISQNLRRVALR